MTSLIEVEGVSKRYGNTLALDDVSFTVRPGAVTGFLGPNGAGKSTAMRVILGLDRPTSGTARVNGTSYRELTAPLNAGTSIMNVPPDPTALGPWTGLAVYAAYVTALTIAAAILLVRRDA